MVDAFAIELDDATRTNIDTIAACLVAADEDLVDERWRRLGLTPGLNPGPAFIFEDQSEIALAPPFPNRLEYRMSLQAMPGDLVGLAGRRVPEFERYLQTALGLPRFGVINARARDGESLGPVLSRRPEVLDAISARAMNSGITVMPYIGSRGAWSLAEALAARSEFPVWVAAGPPPLVECVNDKLWFSDVVRDLLGEAAVPPLVPSCDVRELKANVEVFARRYRRLVVKVPTASGGRGIVVVDAGMLRQLGASGVVSWLADELAAVGWKGEFPLAVGLWDDTVIASPSVQVWIPDADDGSPIVEGVFDQWLDGDQVTFIGAAASELDDEIQRRLAREAMVIASLFQRLGYFGRCSFDAFLCGPDPFRPSINWVECNGRWGGVSTMLTAANRLVGDWRTRPFVVVQMKTQPPVRRTFEELLVLLGQEAFHCRDDATGAIVLSPRALMDGTALAVGILGHDVGEARDLAQRIMARDAVTRIGASRSGGTNTPEGARHPAAASMPSSWRAHDGSSAEPTP